MHFEYKLIPKWPPLSWLARCKNSTIAVFHGSHVEVTDEWFCEAAWAGNYEDGDFDQTDIVAGSGGRVRQGKAIFVSSGSTVDRLSYLQRDSEIFLSNSLPCLLTVADASLDLSYPSYYKDLYSIVYGINKYKRWLITSCGPVYLTYFDNLEWNGEALIVGAKPNTFGELKTFAQYRDLLSSSMQRIADNASSKTRRYPYKMLGTLSSGYDSATVATLAKQAGCGEVLCFAQARGGENDSGEAVATILGLHALIINGESWRTLRQPEIPFLASNGIGEEVRFKAAEQALIGRLLLTGYHGDKMWDKKPKDLSENIVRGDPSGMALNEYRLWNGFLHCPVPFWGVRRIRDVNIISNSREMSQWDVGGDYSRPICRRIVEEAGVPRGIFGVRKLAASVFLHDRSEFLTPESLQDYLGWIEKNYSQWIRHGRIPPITSVRIDRWSLVAFDFLAKWVKSKSVLWRLAPLLEYGPTRLRAYLFPWAIERAKERYAHD